VISSFPQTRKQTTNGILERIEATLQSEAQPRVIFDLAALIVDECLGFLDRAPEEIKILDIYDETISDAV
jgi:hypothetical protein